MIGLIGDGSFQYSVRGIWTAAQHRLPVVYVVMRNREYSILKSFAVLEETPGVPRLDLPGIDIASLARGYGCRTAEVETAGELEKAFNSALDADTTTVIVVSTQPPEGHVVALVESTPRAPRRTTVADPRSKEQPSCTSD